MSEATKTKAADMTSGTEGNGEKTPREKVDIKLYSTQEECEANRPKGAEKDAWKVYGVTRPEKMGSGTVWLWAVGYQSATTTVAREDGYATVAAGGRGPRAVDKGAVIKSMFEHMTETELKDHGVPLPVIESILAARKEAAAKSAAHPANQKPATAPAKGKGK